MSSAAWRKRGEKSPPTRKCFVSPEVSVAMVSVADRGCAPASLGAALSMITAITMTSNQRASDSDHWRVLDPEPRLDGRAARMKSAAGRWMEQVGWAARDPLQHLLRTANRRARLHQSPRVGMFRIAAAPAAAAQFPNSARLH